MGIDGQVLVIVIEGQVCSYGYRMQSMMGYGGRRPSVVGIEG